jgi:hypothetical protein
MDEVTGQAGVSIAVDDVKIYQSIEYLRYYDEDGLTDPLTLGLPTGAGASVGISNLQMMVNINAITGLSSGLPFSPGRSALGDYDSSMNYNNVWGDPGTGVYTDAAYAPSALTIDATEALPVLSTALATKNTNLGLGLTNTNVAGVQIGLPTVEIHQSAIQFDITVADATAINAGTGAIADDSYGQIRIGNQTISILDGTLEIAPH